MKNALKSLTRMKFMSVLIILQLSIGLSMLNSISSIIQDNAIKKQRFDKLVDFERGYMTRIIPKDFNSESRSDSDTIFNRYNKINDIYNEFYSYKKQGFIDSYKIVFPVFFDISEIDKYIPKEFVSGPGDKTAPHRAKIIINDEFLNQYNFNVIEGRSLDDNDFNIDSTDLIPILIGIGYKDKVKVGDIGTADLYTYSNELIKAKFKVVGIMERNSIPSIVTKSNYMESIVYSDYSIVIPSTNSLLFLSNSVALGDQGAYIETNNIDAFENILNSDLEETNMTSRIQSLKEDYEGIMEELKRKVIKSVTLGITLTFLSIIGITSVLLGELNKRKKEFGIRLASGAKLFDICKEITFEIMFMMIFSSILSMILMKIGTSDQNNFISPYLILINIAIVAILTLIISLIPVLKIKKMNIIELVRGK